jgi:hypothetical protein
LLQADAVHKQNLLWWLRKRDAENEAARALRDVERAANELEAETASPRRGWTPTASCHISRGAP